VSAMSMEQAEQWSARAAADRIEVDRDRVAALYVSPSCSLRGIGSALLARAETSIQSSGYATARLESSENALDFYLRRGFRRCGAPDANGAWPLHKELAAVKPTR
jgi:ribosomal protein S18 acetylase RimI-like enzyme